MNRPMVLVLALFLLGFAAMSLVSCEGDDSDLMWQNPALADKMSWSQAMQYCQHLSHDGHSDWYLPTIEEMRSLLRGCSDYSGKGGRCEVTTGCLSADCWSSYYCSCDGGGGPAGGCYWPDDMQGPCKWYWSSSPVQDGKGGAWGIHFNSGLISAVADDPWHVRCVRRR